MHKRGLITGLLAVLTGACGEAPSGALLGESSEQSERFSDNGGLRWGSSDDPSLFDAGLVFDLASLPREGATAVAPWAGHYWPTYKDSINYRWAGGSTPSAAEKYGRAFGVSDVEERISKSFGIAAYESRTQCSDNSACKSELGEVCAKRRDATAGRCIPTWWGVCHAWAPAAILEPEPVSPVTHNGVEFKVQDIKALMTVMYDRVSTKFVSLRCNDSDEQKEIEYDKYGRPTGSDAGCMDTNPGTFHVVLANYLGLRQQSFVHDRMFDHEVWNHPVRGFRVAQLTEVSAAQANALVGAGESGSGEHTERSGSVAKNAWQSVGSFAVQAGQPVTVAMSGTGDADLYVRFGKQPALDGFDCRPYEWGSTERCELTAPAGATTMFVSVRGYEELSSYQMAIDIGAASGGYLFNDAAKKLYHVQLEVQYMDGASSSTDGNLASQADRYTGSDYYEYVLEVDQAGKIFGGEWIGDSKRRHPDFLWLPTTRRYETVADGALSYSNIKSLLDRSLGGGGGGGGGGQQTVINESATVALGAWKHYGPYDVVSGSLTAKLSGGGDADLYVKKGAQPTSSSYDCRPYASSSNEECSVAGPGPIYVSIFGYVESTVQLEVRYTGTGGAPGPTPATTHLNVSGALGRGESKSFTVAVTAGKKIFVRTTGPNDIDLYVQMDAAPTTSSYLDSSAGYSGSEQIELTPSSNGTLHIMVYGYAASTFTLTTSDS